MFFASAIPKMILCFIPLYSMPQVSPLFSEIISFSIYFSSFILPRTIPAMPPIDKPLITYARVIFHPKKPIIKTTKYSLIRGDVIRKEKVTPKGIPASKKLMKSGIEEQEQKGVTAPKREARKFPKTPFPKSFLEP